MYSFLWKPKWILSHVLILALIVSMVGLMLWQLDRLDEKRTLNALITSRADRAPTPLADLLAQEGIGSTADGEAVEFRSTVVNGTYLTDDEFTVPSKTLNGAPGRLVVTPLDWSDTEPPILVLRGFIPQAIDDDVAPIDTVEPPTGEVEITGWLRQTQVPEGIQATAADIGSNRFARLDIDRIEKVRGDLVPVYLQVHQQDPPTAAPALSLYPLPDRTEGPHFSYAMQWGIFTLIAIIGYPLVLRRVGRGGTKDRRDDVPSDEPFPQPEPEPIGS